MRATTPSSCVRRGRSCGAVRVVERRTWPVMPTCTHSKQTGAAASAAADVRSGPVLYVAPTPMPSLSPCMHVAAWRASSAGQKRRPPPPLSVPRALPLLHQSTSTPRHEPGGRPTVNAPRAPPLSLARACAVRRRAPVDRSGSLWQTRQASGRNGARMLRTLRRRTENGTEYECRAS